LKQGAVRTLAYGATEGGGAIEIAIFRLHQSGTGRSAIRLIERKQGGEGNTSLRAWENQPHGSDANHQSLGRFNHLNLSFWRLSVNWGGATSYFKPSNVPNVAMLPPKLKIARLFKSFVLFVNAEVPELTGMICHKAQSATEHGAVG
jgi:hypothetical protein